MNFKGSPYEKMMFLLRRGFRLDKGGYLWSFGKWHSVPSAPGRDWQEPRLPITYVSMTH